MTPGARVLGIAAALALATCRPAPRPDPIDVVLPRAEDGTPFSFAARRGEVTVVFFFTTWCLPCQAQEPAMAELARVGEREGIEVVAVALDREGRRTVAPYVEATRPPYPVLVGGGEVAKGDSPFGHVPELPAVLLLDREGRPAASISGLAPLDLLLARARDVRGRS